MADEQDQAEALDVDEIDPEERGDNEELGDYPPTRLQGANQYGVTAAEESVDEPFEERISRDEPDDLIPPPSVPGTLVAPEEPPDDPYLDADLVPESDLSPEELALHLESDEPGSEA